MIILAPKDTSDPLKRILGHADAIASACLYCLRIYALKDGDGCPGVSHGICPDCIDAVKSSFRAGTTSNLQVGAAA